LGVALTEAARDSERVGAAALALTRFAAHEDIAADVPRLERATMAVRLVRALHANAATAADTFPAAVRRQLSHGSWVDRARTALLSGDTEPVLGAAYAALLSQARAGREVENLIFADRLVAWNASPAASPDVVPVERVLELLVAPVAAERPLLVCCLDGLDLVVWRQLHADLTQRGWTWWQSAASTAAPISVATLPSVTTMSRSSLFAGVAKGGAQAGEKKDFESHPALRAVSLPGKPPVLFHKGTLGDANVLDTAVRKAMADLKQRVVGVVINAVDDWLDRSDQVRPSWSVAAIPLLEALLQEAVLSGRAIAVVSDHGHVLDYDTVSLRSGEGARWRHRVGDPPTAGEVVAAGPRVQAVTGLESVVLASSEAIRYTGKKTGYHGGATPQEVLAPVAVLSRDELGVAGWRPVTDAAPAWWDDRAPLADTGRVTTESTAPNVAPTGKQPTAPAAMAPPWVDALLASPVYRAQRDLAGRTAPSDEQMRTLLIALAARGNRLPLATVAATLGVPEVRVRGIATAVRRVLNIEGYAVVQEDPASGTLSLELPLLRAQFALPG